jgi:hypothetical protein
MLPRKPMSSRKPPEPVPDHGVIEDWISRAMPGLQPILNELDEQIRKANDDLHYAIKWGKAFYGRPDRGWIIEMVAYDISVNVVFLGGADFDDPPPLGETDRGRYIKVKSVEEATTAEMRGWIEEAGRTEGWV